MSGQRTPSEPGENTVFLLTDQPAAAAAHAGAERVENKMEGTVRASFTLTLERKSTADIILYRGADM